MTNEPLVLADGTLVSPQTGEVIKDEQETYVEVPNWADTQRQIVAARTRIADFPCPPSQMTSIGLVLFYSMMGISDDEIHHIIGLTVDQIGRIRVSDAYGEVQQTFLDKIVKHDIDDVRTMFVEGSRTAANKMMSLMDSESENMQLSAAKDVLDRAGQRPVDVIEHRMKVEGGLTIKYVKKDSLEDLPVINGDIL